jgi:biotin carboxyl carrier protein
MQRYQVVVNGNTYTVTVKSLLGSTAIVDVDGWEFQVAISDGDFQTEFVAHPTTAAAPVASPTAPKTSPPPMAPSDKTKKRSSALEQLGPRKATVPEISGKGVVAAHLPGLIIEIAVKEGDTVSRGDLVCKMEAMKMVNEVHAPIDGTVKEILVKEQQNVLENQPLMIIE